MAHDVFISYASGDKPVADAVCSKLEANGIRCWMAPRDVVPGMHYGEAIIDAINECRIMVLVFSSKANLSGHIPKEIERAVSKGVTVMPLRIENVAPAKSLDYFIGSVHWLDALTPPLEAHLRALAANVQTLLSRSAHGAEAHSQPAISPSHMPETLATTHGARHAARPRVGVHRNWHLERNCYYTCAFLKFGPEPQKLTSTSPPVVSVPTSQTTTLCGCSSFREGGARPKFKHRDAARSGATKESGHASQHAS